MMARFDELTYKDYPPASFDQRWGPYDLPPVPQDTRDQLRRKMEEDQFYRTPGGVIPGTPRFADPSKVISQNELPPSLNSPQRQRVPLPSMGDPGQLGAGAGTLPQPDILKLIDELLKTQRRNQGISPGSDAELMRLAGDILPMLKPGQQTDEAWRRLMQNLGTGSMGGDSSVRTLTGKIRPGVDTLGIYQFPSGQPYPARARGGPVEPNQPYTVGEQGSETFVPTRVAEAAPAPQQPQYLPLDQRPKLPPGYRYADEPAPEAKPPPAPEPPPREPAAPADEAQAAREAAAARLQRGQQPDTGRPEVDRPFNQSIPYKVIEHLNETARAAIENPDPQNIARALSEMYTPSAPFVATGKAIAALHGAASPLAEAATEIGVKSIPRAAESGMTGQATARGLAAAPVGGGKLRAASEAATQELQQAGTAAAARPTGQAVAQEDAGSRIRLGIQEAVLAAKTGAGPEVPAKVRALLKKSDEDIIGAVARMAGDAKTGADIKTLINLRKTVAIEHQPAVQSALITRLGQSPTTGEFHPATYVKNYGTMSERAKNLMFGTSREPGSLRYHLDAIEEVSRRQPQWEQFAQKRRSTLGTVVGAGAVAGGLGALATGNLGPLEALGAVVPIGVLSRSLAKPLTAAPIAQWSKAYERLIISGGIPAAKASFNIATRNLNNTLGTNVDPEVFTVASAGEE